MSNPVNQQQLLQALMARMAQARGPGSMSGIPGAAQPAAQAQPQAQAQPPAQAQSQQPQQGGVPGAAGGAARQLSPASPTPFNGTFGDRRGIISQLVNSAEKKGHDKKVNEAEMYYNQINSFLASGQPGDQQKAQQLLDDPKVRKILKTGLDYVPLEEDPPPEALGIHQAQQKITQKASVLNQVKQMLSGGQKQGSAQQRPPGRAVIPQASQQAQQAYQLGEAKTGEQQSLAKLHDTEAEADKVKAAAEQQKADAEDKRVESERIKNEGLAQEAKSHAKLYDKLADNEGDLNPAKKRELQAHANEMDAMGRYHDAMAKYVKTGKLPGSVLQTQLKSARSDMVSVLRGYISDNKDAAKAVSKDTGYVFGPKSGLVKAQDDASKKAKDLTKAIAWFDGEGTDAVTNGKMSLPEAVRKAYDMAGIDAPAPGIGGSDSGAPTSTDDEIMKLIGQ